MKDEKDGGEVVHDLEWYMNQNQMVEEEFPDMPPKLAEKYVIKG